MLDEWPGPDLGLKLLVWLLQALMNAELRKAWTHVAELKFVLCHSVGHLKYGYFWWGIV